MSTLSKIEVQRRLIVLRDRLGETRFIRQLDMKPETAEVWMAIAKGFYDGLPVNIAGVVENTKMDRSTVMRHARLLENEDIPMITIRRRGQDTILRATETSLLDSRVVDYYAYRYRRMIENGEALAKLL